jgi:hypothetical protein
MVLYKGYCRPLGKKVDFAVEDVISMNTKRGIKWRVKGKFEAHNISTFCSAEKAQELLSKLPLKMDAEIAYTPPPNTYDAEELLPSFSNATKKADEIEAEEGTIEVHEQIQENTNAHELELQSEKLPSKYYKKDGSLDMRYTLCREFAAKRAESQNAVELEAPYTPIEPERPSDDYGGGGRHRKKPRRPLGAEEKCDICSEGPIYEKDVNIEDYDNPIQVCQSCFDDTFTDIAAESFEAEDTITVTEIDWETDGEDIDLPTTMKVPADLEEDEIADYLSDQKGWLVNGFVMGAESFEAAYTPEQRLDDYTPKQLTTSSAVTGDFFEDSLKYSYGGFQAETEELGETSYAEDVPALQRAEAGMEVEDIEKAYMKKEDQFMTLVVDDATLFRLAPELPAFVEMESTQLAGYTSLKFNFVENPEMEQKILSYAIDVVDDKDDETEEPEFKEGDVRNRLFNVEFDDWAEQEMLTHGKDVSFKEWADEESESHGDEEFIDWAKHEEESHDERYEAEWRNLSDFEMGDRDRYALGDEIIALSSALKKVGDWDWKNVKKIGKGIKQGKYERIQKHMADIDLKTRRVLWDKHHNDFFDIFTDEQIRGLAIPWVVNDYRAEITDEDLSELESKLDRKIDSYVMGLNYAQCVACPQKAKVEILEDKEGKALYHFYSCECGHNDIQDSSYDAETFEAPADGIESLREAMKKKKEKLTVLYEELRQRDKDLKNKHDSDIATYGKVLGDKKFTDRIAVTEKKILKHINSMDKLQEKINAKFKLGARDDFVLKKIRSNDPTANTASESTYRFDHRYSGSARQRNLLKKKAEESFEAPSAFDNEDIIAYLENSHRSIRKYNAPHRYTSRGIANHFGVARSNISKRMKILKDEGMVSQVKRRVEDSPDEYGKNSPVSVFYLTRNKLMQAEESDGFIGRIPKSKGMREKTEILKNNINIIFEEAQRPLYPLEVMTLYEQKKYGDKPQRKSKYKSSPRAKKLGITQKKLSQIINSQRDRYYVSRRGLIHYIGGGSMQDYIKNLDPKYFAEDETSKMPTDDIILKYLENSHRFIRKYNAPYKYSSRGMAQKFGVHASSMRKKLVNMERNGKIRAAQRRCEDAPKENSRNRVKIYYLYNNRLMGAENRSPSYMVDSDVDSLVDSSERLEDMVDERNEYPEWWKSQLSVSSDKVDGLADFLEYAERKDKV